MFNEYIRELCCIISITIIKKKLIEMHGRMIRLLI